MVLAISQKKRIQAQTLILECKIYAVAFCVCLFFIYFSFLLHFKFISQFCRLLMVPFLFDITDCQFKDILWICQYSKNPSSTEIYRLIRIFGYQDVYEFARG
jgi:hypothetical protein